MSAEPALRSAVERDLAAIRAVARAAYAPYVARIGREPAPMVADFASAIAAGQMVVVDLDGAVVGFAVRYRRGDHVHLENVAVAPDAQGRGVGRLLIDETEALAATLGLSAVELYTNAKMTENLALYPRLGYVETDRRSEDGFDRVYFRKPLAR